MANGVTADTWKNLIIDAGVVYVNYGLPGEFILGATNGGVTFGFAEFTMRAPEVDGLKGPLAGTQRITAATPQIEVNLVEWKRAAVRLALPGCDEVESGGMVTFTRSGRNIPLSDYPSNMAVVGTQSGTGRSVIALIRFPISTGGFSLPMTDDAEATAALVFVGNYDPANSELEPWEIRFPDETETVELRQLVVGPALSITTAADPGDVVSTIAGAAEGSTLVTTSAMFAIEDGELVVGAGALVAGVQSFAIVETLAGAVNSPRASPVTVTVTAP